MGVPPPVGDLLTAAPQAISPLCEEGSLQKAFFWRRELYVARSDCIGSRADHSAATAAREAASAALVAANIRERDAASRVAVADKTLLTAWHNYHFLVRTTSHTHLQLCIANSLLPQLSQAEGKGGVVPGSPQPADKGKGKDPVAPIDVDDDDDADADADAVEDLEPGDGDIMDLSDDD